MGNGTRYLCDCCETPVEIHQGKKTGLAWYRCGNCGLSANFKPGTTGFADLVEAGLVEAVG